MGEINQQILKELSDKYGNSFYLLDSQLFRENYTAFHKAFSNEYSNFNIAYSVKTNYLPAILKIVKELGGYAEVVSEMEMNLALRCGFNPTYIIWNGPVKEITTVKDFLISGGIVNIDSVEEIHALEPVVQENPEHMFNIGIRCNFPIGDGVVSRFGFDISGDDFKEVLNFVKKNKNVVLENIQCHFASRKLDFWSARAEGMIKIYTDIVNKYELKPKRIDLGGGMSGNMSSFLRQQFDLKEITYADYAANSAKIIKKYFDNEEYPELTVEPGTALVGDCVKFAAKVISIKNIRGKFFVTVDGSQKNISMQNINPYLEVFHSGKRKTTVHDADIVGYTCIESDVIYRNYSGKLAVEDFILVSDCGSYSIVMKPPFIKPNVPIFDIGADANTVDLIKCSENFDDIFHTYKF